MKTTTIITTILLSVFLLSCNSSYKKQEEYTKQLVDSLTKELSKNDKIQHAVDNDNSFVIRGLGDYNQDSLISISKYIKEFYNYDCKISQPVKTSSNMYANSSNSIEASKLIQILDDPHVKTIYVTNENLINGSLPLRGATYLESNTVILKISGHNKKTVLHEIGHTLGLDHCDNKNCLMSIYNDDHVVKDFCDKCKKTLKENEKFQ